MKKKLGATDTAANTLPKCIQYTRTRTHEYYAIRIYTNRVRRTKNDNDKRAVVVIWKITKITISQRGNEAKRRFY